MVTKVPSSKGAHPPFSAHVRCGQTAGWIKVPLDREVGFCPGDVVLDGDPDPPKRGTAPTPPVFVLSHICLLWPYGWTDMKMPLGTEVDLGPGHIVLDPFDPALPAKGAQQPPLFSADVYCGHGRPSQLYC